MTGERLPRALAGRYRVAGELGRGGFGVVLALEGIAEPLRHALKLLPLDADEDRALRELRAVAQVEHPHLLRILDVGREGGRAWILMERAEGSLRALMDAGRRPEAWEVVRQAGGAVAALHEVGILHRDLKPENILVAGGGARLADLGLAKGGDLRTVTEAGLILGTPAYMSPEQARGEKLGPASDVFSLGVILAEVADARLPYRATEALDLVVEVARGGAVERVELGGLEPGAAAVLRRFLDPDPEARPADLPAARAVLGELAATPGRDEATVVVSPPVAEPAGVPTPPAGVARRGGRLGRGLLPGAFLLGALGGGFLFGTGPTATDPGPAPPPAVPAPGEARGASLLRAVARCRAELSDAATWVREGEEVLRGDRASLGEGRVAFLVPDPARWGEIVAALPELRALLAELAATPVEGAGEEARRVVAELGERYRSEGLVQPFAGWLGSAPAPPAGDPRVEFAPELELGRWGSVPMPEPPGPLARTALRAFRRVREILRARREEAQGPPPWGMGEHLAYAYRGMLLGEVAGQGSISPAHMPRNFIHDPALRVDLEAWLGVRDAVQRMLYAACRSLREEPATRPFFAVHVARWVDTVDDALNGALADLDPRVWLPLGTGSPEERLVLQALLRAVQEFRHELGEDEAAVAEEVVGIRAGFLAGPAPPPERPEAWWRIVVVWTELSILRRRGDHGGLRRLIEEYGPEILRTAPHAGLHALDFPLRNLLEEGGEPGLSPPVVRGILAVCDSCRALPPHDADAGAARTCDLLREAAGVQ